MEGKAYHTLGGESSGLSYRQRDSQFDLGL